MQLKPAAHLWICPTCGGSAKIVFPDGTSTRQFITKQFGLELIDALHKEGRVDEHERKHLRQAVNESRLARIHEFAEQVYQAQQDHAHDDEPAPATHIPAGTAKESWRTAAGDPIN